MENKEFKDIWMELDGILTPKSKDELREILEKRAKRQMKKMIIPVALSFTLSLGALVFFIFTMFGQLHDSYYVINNLVGAVLILFYLTFYFVHLWRLSSFKGVRFSVSQSINHTIWAASQMLRTRMEAVLAPLLGISLILSIHGYFSVYELADIGKDSETLWGLVFGAVIALVAVVIVNLKIRRYFQEQLRILKHYQTQLSTF